MAPLEKRARYETALARAHRATHVAFILAEEMGEDGAADDLWHMLQHLTTLGQASIAAPRSAAAQRARRRSANERAS